MQVNDPHHWSLQEQAFGKDEEGRQMLNYITHWVDSAEQIIAVSADMAAAQEDDPQGHPVSPLDPYVALQRALVQVEEEVGMVDGEYIGQMLMFIVGNWVHGQYVAEHFTNVEMKIVTSAVLVRNQLMAQMAEGAPESENVGPDQ